MQRALKVVLVLALGLSVRGATAQNGNTPSELREIRFAGAAAFPDALLRGAIVSEESACSNIMWDVLQVCRLGLAREKSAADAIALQSDVLRLRKFYFDRGYREARISVDTLTRAHVMRATFRITEGSPVTVSTVELKGLEQFDSTAQRRLRHALPQLPLTVGSPLSLISYEAGRDSLLDRLHNLGYARAEVFAGYLIPRDAPRSARVEYSLVPGERAYFGQPVIRGNARVSENVIKRMLAFRAGDAYSREAILRSQRNLFALDVFRNIDIRVDLTAEGDTLRPVVDLSERTLNRFRAGVGLNTSEFINAEGRWIAKDFLGGARSIEVRGRMGNVLADPLRILPGFEDARAPYDALNGSITVDFNQPWFFHPNNNLGLGVFLERRSIPDVFVRTARGGYIAVARLIGAGVSATVGYRPELTRLDAQDLIFCTSFTACEESEIRVLRDPHWLAPVTLSFVRDRSNSLFAPTRGSVLRLETEYAARASGSEFSYTRVVGEFTTYREPLRGLVLATRVRPGWARARQEPGAGLGLHPQKRFFAGGANSVRGFGQYRLGPQLITIDAVEHLTQPDPESGFAGCSAHQINAGTCDVSALAAEQVGFFDVRPVGGAISLEGNIELRFPLVGDKLRGAAFLDVGQVWSRDQAVRFGDLVPTPGFGFRYFSAIGPVRIDLGYNPQQSRSVGVLTTTVCDKAAPRCESSSIDPGENYGQDDLANTRELRSLGFTEWNPIRSFRDRLALHFSIGQAF